MSPGGPRLGGRYLPRDEAMERIRRERAPGDCLICGIRDGAYGPTDLLAGGALTTVVLTRFPRRWGHLLVLVNEHVTRFSDLAPAAWLEASARAHRAARAVERALRPLRCYVASLGAARDDLVASSPHVHLHVIPVYSDADTPGSVLSWNEGVLTADEPSWRELFRALSAAWDAEGEGEPRP